MPTATEGKADGISDSEDVVACVDVGSIREKNFAWACSTGEQSVSPDALVTRVTDALARGHRVALGFESPSWIPVPDAPTDLGRKRPGEGSRPWSAGPGAAVLATGLAQIGWILHRIAIVRGGVAVTTIRAEWNQGRPLLLWEAFVSADRKANGPDGHIADAQAGILAFQRNSTLVEEPTVVGGVVNLLAVLSVWAGLQIDDGEQRSAHPIYAPPPNIRVP